MIHIYAKTTDDLSLFEPVIEKISDEESEISLTLEARRSFRLLEQLLSKVNDTDIIIAYSISALGLNDADILNVLSFFVERSIVLVLCDTPASYEFGISQPMNKAVIMTLMSSFKNNNKNIISVSAESSKRSNSGRKKIEFPDQWDELYRKWEDKEITSGEFLKQSKLKKATFYNLMTEYREIQQQKEAFVQKYKLIV